MSEFCLKSWGGVSELLATYAAAVDMHGQHWVEHILVFIPCSSVETKVLTAPGVPRKGCGSS